MKTIMAIDDSRSMLRFIRFTLESEGFRVVTATDGRQAIELLEQRVDEPVDMVITDLYMPEVNGLEVIETLRAWEPYRFVPIVMLTTESHAERKEAGRRAGATGWIVKPFEPEQLVGVVRRVLGVRSSVRASAYHE